MKRTEIPAVKCYGYADPDEGLCSVIWEKDSAYTPCILRTAAADKPIVELAKAAIDLVKSGENMHSAKAWKLHQLVHKLEKAGVKL